MASAITLATASALTSVLVSVLAVASVEASDLVSEFELATTYGINEPSMSCLLAREDSSSKVTAPVRKAGVAATATVKNCVNLI